MCDPQILLLAWVSVLPALLGPDALLRGADAPWHVLEEGVLHVRAVVQERDAQSTESVLDVYVRGVDHTLCVFREGPLTGRRILTVRDRVWLILPHTTHPIRISANQRLLGGASITDVARLRLADDFSATRDPEVERIDGVACHTLRLKARSPRAAYSSGTLWVGTADGLARRARLSLPSGMEAKELRFLAYGDDAGRPVLRRLEIHHLLAAERGAVTTLEFLGYDSRAVALEWFDPQRARELP